MPLIDAIGTRKVLYLDDLKQDAELLHEYLTDTPHRRSRAFISSGMKQPLRDDTMSYYTITATIWRPRHWT